MPRVTVSRRAHFNAAHRLYNKGWSPEHNEEVFGKCNNPNFHGHNYQLIVEVTGEVDPETGYVMDMKRLADLIELKVEQAFDHRNLNLDCPEFADLNPTAENIAIVIWHKLRPEIDNNCDLNVILHETERNAVHYRGE